MHNVTKSLIATACMAMLTGCAGFFDKDNTPQPKALTDFRPEIQPHLQWKANVGKGVGSEYLKMGPAVGDSSVFVPSVDGTVTAVNKTTGRTLWQTRQIRQISTSPGVGEGMVVVGSNRGDIAALDQETGALRWKIIIPGEIMATPSIGSGHVVVKTIDGYVRSYASTDGHEQWSTQQVEPSLILHGSSAPLVRNQAVVVGYANGNLAKLNLSNGETNWMQTVAIPSGAFAIQRMIDIDADPLMFDHHLYAATYQGKIASLDFMSGRILWSHDLSSYTGMIADSNTAYVSDAKSHVWAFNADSGLVNWRQTDLEARIVTGPATMGNYIVVGDGQGFLHWLSKRDGHFAARQSTGGAVYAAPINDNGVLYVLTTKGYLLAYTLNT